VVKMMMIMTVVVVVRRVTLLHCDNGKTYDIVVV